MSNITRDERSNIKWTELNWIESNWIELRYKREDSRNWRELRIARNQEQTYCELFFMQLKQHATLGNKIFLNFKIFHEWKIIWQWLLKTIMGIKTCSEWRHENTLYILLLRDEEMKEVFWSHNLFCLIWTNVTYIRAYWQLWNLGNLFSLNSETLVWRIW